MKVLVLDGSSGQSHGALGAVRALGKAGHRVDVAHAEPRALAARSRYCAERHRIPGTDAPDFAEQVRRLMEAGGYDSCLPTSDAALVALDWPGADLVDKRVVRRRWAEAGGPGTRTWELGSGAELLDRAGELPFPVAVKSAVKAGAGETGVWRADSAADLARLATSSEPVFVEEWLEGEQRAVAGVVAQGRLRAVVHQRYVRTWPRDCGVASAAVTTGPDLELEQRLVRLLRGYDGIFQCQLIGGHLHDVNPRVFGSVLLGYRAGVNLPHLAVTATSGADQGPGAEPVRGRPGVRYRWLEGDLRHVLAAARDGAGGRSGLWGALRPEPGTVHPDLWLSDPAPTLARARFAVRRASRRTT